MGIFGVNMPILCGEKKNSFIRLQGEIMKNSDDHSPFAWKGTSTQLEAFTGPLTSLPRHLQSLAVSPHSGLEPKQRLHDNQQNDCVLSLGLSKNKGFIGLLQTAVSEILSVAARVSS